LLRAAIEVIGERGLAGATHKAVTERAEVPLATASYYFSSIAELLNEALHKFIAERADDLASFRHDSDVGALEIVRWFAEQIMGVPQSRALAFYEVLINAARYPELRDSVTDVVSRFQGAAEAGLEAAGANRPDAAARPFLALGLGFGLLHLAQPGDTDTSDFEAAMAALFLAYTIGEDDWEAWLAQLR
jgi:DNA-binding transcriptional regulator YbjK